MNYSSELEDNIRKYENAKDKGECIYFDVDTLMDIADYYYSNGDIKHSVDVAEYALALFPGAVLPLCFLARQALNERNIPKAELYAGQIEDRSDIEYSFLLAEIHISKGETDEADCMMKDVYDKDADSDKDDLAVDTAQMFLEYGIEDKCSKWLTVCRNKNTINYKETRSKFAISEGDFDEAEELTNQLLDQDPFSTAYWVQLAAIQFQKGDTPKSLESCDYALAIDSHNIEAIMQKGNCLSTLDNDGEAIEYFKRCIELRPDADLGYMLTGVTLSNNGQFQEAIPYLLKGLKLAEPASRTSLHVCKELAYCYSSIQNMEKALYYINLARMQIGSDEADMQCLTAICYIANNHPDEAEKHFRQALKVADYSQQEQIYIDFSAASIDFKHPEVAYATLKEYFLDNRHIDANNGWSYLALACYQLKDKTDFASLVKIACIRNAEEARLVLGNLFPQGTMIEDYPFYAKLLLQ